MAAEAVVDPGTALAAGVGDLLTACAALAEVDVHGVAFTALAETAGALERVRRQVAGLEARVLAAVDADGRWATGGARTLPAWVRQITGAHPATAARRVRTARALRDVLPAAAAALAAGDISDEHVGVLIRHATDTPARVAQLADPEMGEEFLVGCAAGLDVARFTRLVAHWAIRTDPDAADRSYADDLDREELFISDVPGGSLLRGFLATANATALKEALTARTGVPPAGDTRTPAQRRAAALNGITHLALDSGTLQPTARIRPHLAVTTTLDTLLALTAASAGGADGASGSRGAGQSDPGTGTGAGAGDVGAGGGQDTDVLARITADLDPGVLAGVEAATLADNTPIPFTLLARLACASAVHRVIFGPDAEILDVGREERLFTTAQTRAIIARDRHCQYPGCDAPPGEGEIHHNLWWYAHHGPTDITNAILLCWHHHDHVHAQHITIERHPTHWRFLDRHGTPIGKTAIRAPGSPPTPNSPD
ncbi:DUF222 domain-containing protein [Georgenia sp. M64]|uniref:HNH endonuclease signature motif containing protein n=1 Tax=Georgenia sp. M64 TaxID=3120520 RepID=UPI0030E4B188